MNKMIIVGSLALATLFIIADTHHTGCAHKKSVAPIYQATYPFSLPALPYAYNALEPYIDKQTMEIHHTKHHQAYVDNLNKALEGEKALHGKTLFELISKIDALPEKVRSAVRNQGGGHFNHSLFWTMMMPDAAKAPSGKLAEIINKTFGSFAKFQDEFNAKAKTVFGSGWAWLVTDAQGNLTVITTSNQDAPIANKLTPILGLDVWEHGLLPKIPKSSP